MGAKSKIKGAERAPVAVAAKGDKQSAAKGDKPSTAKGEKQHAAAATQPSIFGNWTGKTPVTLLNEYMQRMGWHRANYNVQEKGGRSYCTIALRKEDKKLRQPVSVHFRPVATESMALWHGTALHARHAAATYVLHRLRSNTNMHMLLPLDHRAYWLELEQIRKGDSAEWMYAEDPFAAKAAREKQAEQQQAEHTKRVELRERAQKGHKEELLPPALRRRWDEMAEVHMSEQGRARVEQVVRTWTSNWDLAETVAATAGAPATADRGGVDVAGLEKLGFRRQHVEEARRYASSRDGALDWLCVHVPEDDLPEQFLQRKYQGAAVIVAPTSDNDGSAQHSLLSRRLAAKRLARSGFPTSICLAAVEQALEDLGPERAGDLLSMIEARAASNLLSKLCERDPPMLAAVGDDDAIMASVNDEVAALDAIFMGEDRVSRPSPFQVCFSLRPKNAKLCADDAQLVFWFPPGIDYPEQLPAMTLASSEMPAYFKLHIARKLNAHIGSGGLPVMFEAVCLAEDQIEHWLAAPPPLVGLLGTMACDTAAPTKRPVAATTAKAKGSSRVRASVGAQDNSERLCREFAQLQLNEAYRRMQRERARLPVAAKRDLITELISSNRCVVVAGATGCGKTTQIPQFILDAALADGKYVNIVCTQPRRISAIGVAARVAEERAGALGAVVGYAVRGESKQGRDTRLLFCTTGVLLRMLAESKDLDHITHVVCDEVHERSVDSDLLLILLRQCQQRNKTLKVVLMSATAQSSRFADYFGHGVPMVDIPGRTFPVDDVYVEDFARGIPADELFGAAFMHRARGRLESARARCASGEGKGIDEAQAFVARAQRHVSSGASEEDAACLATWDEKHCGSGSAAAIDYAMVDRVVRHIHATSPAELAVLVFVPGVAEIQRCMEMVSHGATDLHVLPLHAGLAPGEQRRVFGAPPAGRRKVVVATNVAETSITIEDIGFVVDTGRVREVQYSAESRVAQLVTTFCSQAAATQRRGRAGRRQKGVCYRIYTRAGQERTMQEYTTPEIQRTPLEQVCLQAKALGYPDAWGLLGGAMDAPEPKEVEGAEELLVAVGACGSAKGALLALGRWMARIPVDLRLAKMLVLGAALGVCFERVLRLVALMSLRSLYAAAGNRELIDEARRQTGSAQSDWLADLAILEKCLDAPPWAWPPFVSRIAVSEAKSSIRTLRETMAQLGLAPSGKGSGKGGGSGDHGDEVLKALVLAGLSPNIARVAVPRQKYQETISGTISVERHARELALFVPDAPCAAVGGGGGKGGHGWRDRRSDRRVFIHPQSTMFSEASYKTPFAAYFRMHASPMAGGKLMLRDVTVPSMYALLLFGPCVVVDHEYKVVEAGQGLSVRAWPRIGVLVASLRRLLDELLRRRLDDAALDICAHPVVETVLHLIQTDGALPP
ncbi:helicase, partial [Coemansia biformis]